MRTGLCLMCFILAAMLQAPRIVVAQKTVKQSGSWHDVKTAGKGSITVYWYETRPFIYKTPLGMRGIEYEIMEGFRVYLEKTYGVVLTLTWKQANSFGDTYTLVRTAKQPGIFGASAFSITPERKSEVGFSPSYMSDISVLITSKNIPIVESTRAFNDVFSKLTAITIAETTYEQDILKLKHQGNLPFRIQYIPGSESILEAIAAQDSAFGFIDLPVYMMIFNEDPSVNVKRQNLFPVRREGYAFIYPQHSDWHEPLDAYFSSKNFPAELEKIIGHYIDIELHYFIESLAIQPNDIVVLLTKEKEIQYKELQGKSAQIARDAQTRNFLLALVGIISIFFLFIVLLYRKRSQQKEKIEMQQRSIEQKNAQLEKRNHDLIALDEEKNNLIKILAHDLRTPINHMQGLARVFLLDNDGLPEDQKMIIRRINDASIRLNKMISNILDIDAIENNRVKLVMDEIAVGTLVNQVVRSFDKQALKKNIELSIEVYEDCSINGDVLFLTQVLENLISNAIKFSERGKKVEVRVLTCGDKIRISVKDAGPGLTEEDFTMLFRKFQRLSARPTDGEISTGLGLSIVKKYVELMDGKVWCESEAGKGADFIVEFPKS